MRVPRVVSAVSLLIVAGCSHGVEQPRRVALDFAHAVSRGSGDTACAVLAPGTRHELESSAGMQCDKAVLDQQLPMSSRVLSSERYGDEALVVLDHDTVFVARFSIGWRVVAAGCTDRGPDRPFDCTISGS